MHFLIKYSIHQTQCNSSEMVIELPLFSLIVQPLFPKSLQLCVQFIHCSVSGPHVLEPLLPSLLLLGLAPLSSDWSHCVFLCVLLHGSCQYICRHKEFLFSPHRRNSYYSCRLFLLPFHILKLSLFFLDRSFNSYFLSTFFSVLTSVMCVLSAELYVFILFYLYYLFIGYRNQSL